MNIPLDSLPNDEPETESKISTAERCAQEAEFLQILGTLTPELRAEMIKTLSVLSITENQQAANDSNITSGDANPIPVEEPEDPPEPMRLQVAA